MQEHVLHMYGHLTTSEYDLEHFSARIHIKMQWHGSTFPLLKPLFETCMNMN